MMSSDVLNRLHPSKHLKPHNLRGVWIDPDPREQAAHARHLAKYIFPRQFGLSNPFTVDLTVFSVHRLPDYFDREQSIKVYSITDSMFLFLRFAQALGSVKTPKRLKTVLHRLEQLIWHHGKCGYKPLLQRLCPSKVRSSC